VRADRKLAVALVPLALLLASCGDDYAQEHNDAGKIANLDSDALIITMPNGFSNVAAKCVGTDLLYAAINSNGRAIAVSPSHPWCADGILTLADTQR
jgi:hypothetical protein